MPVLNYWREPIHRFGMYFIFPLFGITIPFIYCLLFGALISPTDPIAVLGILKAAKIPASIEMKITGESLFNDGVGVVVFASILEITRIGTDNLSVGDIGILFLEEAGGGYFMGTCFRICGLLPASFH